MSAGPDGASRCPACGSNEVIGIVYGFPTSETFEAASRGEVALGGCVIEFDSPDHECRACQQRFRGELPPVRRWPDPERGSTGDRRGSRG